MTNIPDALARAFYKYGKFVARHPLPFLLLPPLVTCLFAIGLLNVSQTSDAEYLYVPVNAPSLDKRHYFDTYFAQDDETHFSASRLIFLEGFIQVHIETPDRRNVLTDDVFDAVNTLNDLIESHELTYDGQVYTYADICGKWNGTCSSNGIIDIYHENGNSFNGFDLSYPIHQGQQRFFVLTQQIGVVSTNEDGVAQSARAVELSYFLQSSDDVIDVSNAWLDAIRDELFDFSDSRVVVEFQTSNTLSQELEGSLGSIIPLFVGAYNVLAIFAVISCLMFDPVRSKPWVAMSGMVAAALGIGSTIGLMSAAGVKFASVVGTMPFLIIGKPYVHVNSIS